MNYLEGHARIGRSAWNLLVAHYGGSELDVPTNSQSSAGKRLAEQIGQDAAADLIAYAAGDRLYIAEGWEQILASRYERIVAMHSAGQTPSEIARAFVFTGRYSERNIRMILAGRFEDLRCQLGSEFQPGLPGL
jgi:hypothetical protein